MSDSRSQLNHHPADVPSTTRKRKRRAVPNQRSQPHSLGLFVRIHRDEQGTISIASVFALLMLVFVLGMVMNSTRQIDRKVKMQNAADAATQAGALQVTRSMNSLAFTNHLLADVFALTAFFREARDQNAASATVEILDHWRRVGPELEGSEFPRFDALGRAITDKVPLEEELVISYSLWALAASEIMLPVFESIIAEEMIPNYQRALVLHTPRLAQYAADQVARRHGQSWPVNVELRAVLWRTIGDPVGGASEDFYRTLPVVDPILDNEFEQQQYVEAARSQRNSLSHRYLDEWNNESLRFFDQHGKMSQFSNLWRTFTCGHLDQLLGENVNRNLPMQIRRQIYSRISNPNDPAFPFDPFNFEANQELEADYMFVGVVYAERLYDRIPRMFENPIQSTSTAYAQAQFFVPRRRLVSPTSNFVDRPFGSNGFSGTHQGGVPGDFVDDPPPYDPRELLNAEIHNPGYFDYDEFFQYWRISRQSGSAYPTSWDLLTQNWESQLVPATCEQLPQILSQSPQINGVNDIDLTDLSGISIDELRWLNHH